MDILYLTPQTINELAIYCERELITKVLEHFRNYGEIVIKGNDEKPSRWWDISSYISNHTIDSKHKLAVILSLARIGGFIQIGKRQEVGEVNTMCMLKDMGYISESDFEYFIKSFYNFTTGNKIKFSL